MALDKQLVFNKVINDMRNIMTVKRLVHTIAILLPVSFLKLLRNMAYTEN